MRPSRSCILNKGSRDLNAWASPPSWRGLLTTRLSVVDKHKGVVWWRGKQLFQGLHRGMLPVSIVTLLCWWWQECCTCTTNKNTYKKDIKQKGEVIRESGGGMREAGLSLTVPASDSQGPGASNSCHSIILEDMHKSLELAGGMGEGTASGRWILGSCHSLLLWESRKRPFDLIVPKGGAYLSCDHHIWTQSGAKRWWEK